MRSADVGPKRFGKIERISNMKAQPARIPKAEQAPVPVATGGQGEPTIASQPISTAEAFGRPGIDPRWTHGGKDGLGTAYAASSRIWFTLWNGIITEVYYPTVDRPQLRDLQYLICDGKSLFQEEKRHLNSKLERFGEQTLGYRCTNSDPEKRYTIVKDIIAHPALPCILQHTKLAGDAAILAGLRFYALCAPHLEVGGWGNGGYVIEVSGRKILMAKKGETWLALGATAPFSRLSCGYVGRSDGWTDLAQNFRMDWQFGRASDGNIALMGELDLDGRTEFTLGLGFGDCEHRAITTLLQALGTPFEQHRALYVKQWSGITENVRPLQSASSDDGHLYRTSLSLLRAHEDKSYPGAFVASLSIPWGQAKGDQATGGYHMVWTRDMVGAASALLAAGDLATPLRALIYLAVCQEKDGGFAQNFSVDGTPHWTGVQLDEVAFPILLAWQLKKQNALQDFDPYPMILKAAAFLVRHGPVTQQERWEEASGYSPSTLASNIAALMGAAWFARARGSEATASFLEDYADFLESHIESWTVTTQGSLVPGIRRHYIRILPEDIDNESPVEDPDSKTLTFWNVESAPASFPAKDIVDAGFLQLVRYGIRNPHDPLIADSLKVVDAVLKVRTPFGDVWHRYNHDGYGQREDGGSYVRAGKGRAWPLLTGERGHYELAAGRDAKPFARTMERLASPGGLLPEQVWDEPDKPQVHMFLGRPTGAAMPLAWAHAEYIKLVRSISDGQVFDFIPEVASRYGGGRTSVRSFEIWKFNRQVRSLKRGRTLRIQASSPFRLHWSDDGWRSLKDTQSSSTALDVHFVDIRTMASSQSPVCFTFFWTADEHWEGRNYQVTIE
jgi:glucoamylase